MAASTGDAPLRPGALVKPGDKPITADVVIIGTGMGGGTLAWALKDSGLASLWSRWSSAATSCPAS